MAPTVELDPKVAIPPFNPRLLEVVTIRVDSSQVKNREFLLVTFTGQNLSMTF